MQPMYIKHVLIPMKPRQTSGNNASPFALLEERTCRFGFPYLDKEISMDVTVPYFVPEC